MRRLTTAITIAAITGTAPAFAADEAGGTRLSFGVSTTARYDDNWNLDQTSAGNTTQLLTTLTFGASSTTHVQSAGIEGGLGVQYLDLAGEGVETGASNPWLRAHYEANGASSKFSSQIGWSKNDRSLNRVGQQGTAIDTNARVAYSFGQDLPFGGDVLASYDRVTYSDVADSDTQTRYAKAGLHFDLSSSLTITAGGSFKRYTLDEVIPQDTDTSEVSLGAQMRLNGTDTLGVTVARNRISEEFGDEATGTTGSVKYTHKGSTVTTTATAASALSLQGTRTSLTVDRTHDLQDETLAYGLGLVRDTQDQTLVSAHLEWKQQVRATAFDVALRRDVNTSSDGYETLSNSLRTSVKHDINDTTNVSTVLKYTSDDELGGTNTRSGSATVSLGFALGDDWELSVGAEHRMTVDDTDVYADSNAIFATIGKSWVSFR